MASNDLFWVCVSVDERKNLQRIYDLILTDSDWKSQLSILISIDSLEMTFQSWTKLIIKFWHHRSQYKFAILSPPPPSTPTPPSLPTVAYLKMITKEIASKQVRTWLMIIVLECGLYGVYWGNRGFKNSKNFSSWE